MTLVDIDHVEQPLELDKFKLIPLTDYPYCVIGFQLKNLYDQERIKIKSSYTIENVIHSLPTSKVTPTIFRGIKINTKPEFNSLLKQLISLNVSFFEGVDIEKYKNLLGEYNLTCDECYAFLRKGIYPIDGKCLSIISDTDLKIEDLYNSFDTSRVPAYQSFCSFTIYILCNESLFSKSSSLHTLGNIK